MEAIKDERHQAENVEVDGSRRVPAARKNEKSDEEIQNGGDAQVILDAKWLFLRCCDQRHLERFVAAPDFVLYLAPDARVEQQPGNVRSAVNRNGVNSLYEVAFSNAGLSGGRTRSDVPGSNAGGGIDPGDSVVRCDVLGPLPEVQIGEY